MLEFKSKSNDQASFLILIKTNHNIRVITVNILYFIISVVILSSIHFCSYPLLLHILGGGDFRLLLSLSLFIAYALHPLVSFCSSLLMLIALAHSVQFQQIYGKPTLVSKYKVSEQRRW